MQVYKYKFKSCHFDRFRICIIICITQCLFSDCRSKESVVVNIGKCRCLTISHACCSRAYSKKEGAPFLYSKWGDNDFSIVLYNTVVDSSSDSSYSYALYPHNGNQYYRYNNVTNCNCGGFQFDAVKCFSFAMNTIANCELTNC